MPSIKNRPSARSAPPHHTQTTAAAVTAAAHLHIRLQCSTANKNTASGSGRLLAPLWSCSASSTAAVTLVTSGNSV